MKNKVFKTIIVLILILLLTMTNFVLVGYNVVIAVSDNLEGQDNTTNIQNIKFDAYLMLDNSKTYEKQIDMMLNDTLILYICVKDKGILNDAKIQINNANFKIIKEEVQNSYVKDINEETSEITLNPIASGNDIEIQIPIQFKRQEIFDMNYFNQESTIAISGIYKDEAEHTVSGEKNIKINWSTTTDVGLNQNIEKYLSLGENGVLIQQDIVTSVVDDKLPREQETLNITVPVIDEQKPNDIYVLLNGEKLEQANVNYDEENSILEVKNRNLITTDNQTEWGSAENKYQVIYIYPSIIGEIDRVLDFNTTLKTKLFTQDEIQKQDIQNIEIVKNGNIVNIEKAISINQIYKGYLYANTENEISFNEEDRINISYIDGIENVQLETMENQFANDANEEYSANSSVKYRGITLNKENMLEILGQDGNITIQDETGATIEIINSSTESDENGNINISYDVEKSNVKIITSKPITEGMLVLNHTKVLKGTNNYAKQQLKEFTKLITRSKVVASLGEEIGEATVLLQDTKTEAKLELNNTSLSTLQTNENVQFLITLKSNNEQYDLYKNPFIEIVLPQELSVNVKNITQLNRQEEISIVNPTMHKNENDETIIQMQLQGEQTSFENDISEGIQIAITADISIDKSVPSGASQIIMNYTNENREGENLSYQLPININSKYGVLLINELTNYNSNGDILESTDDKIKEATLDINSEAKVAEQQITLLNNYENDITDIELIGQMPESGEETINEEQLKATFGTKLLDNVEASGKTAKIYYSEDANAASDSDTWQEGVQDFSTIKSFKLELEDNKLAPGEVVNIASQIEVPENLDYNQSSYIDLNLSYNYLGDNMQTKSTMSLKTAENQEEIRRH